VRKHPELAGRSDSLAPRFKSAIDEFLARLKKELGTNLEVYLFGSLARGEWLAYSDIDLVVVCDRLKGLSRGSGPSSLGS
jgi:predicted nucleotidyltransferase